MKYLLGVVLILTSCTVNKDYYLDVPKGYEFKGYEVTIEKERRYVYNDSSFVYITNFRNTHAGTNLQSLSKKKKNHYPPIFLLSTISLSAKKSLNLAHGQSTSANFPRGSNRFQCHFFVFLLRNHSNHFPFR
jgi:hypothetical protein